MAYPANSSVLETIKSGLGLTADYTPFDVEILMYINTAVSNLKQLGVDSPGGVDDATTWDNLIPEDSNFELENIKTYILIKVKLVFDVTSLSTHHINALKDVLDEQEWRIKTTANPPAENMPPSPTLVGESDV